MGQQEQLSMHIMLRRLSLFLTNSYYYLGKTEAEFPTIFLGKILFLLIFFDVLNLKMMFIFAAKEKKCMKTPWLTWPNLTQPNLN